MNRLPAIATAPATGAAARPPPRAAVAACGAPAAAPMPATPPRTATAPWPGRWRAAPSSAASAARSASARLAALAAQARLRAALAVVTALVSPISTAAAEPAPLLPPPVPVTVPSLDRADGRPIGLPALWFPAPAAAAAAAGGGEPVAQPAGVDGAAGTAAGTAPAAASAGPAAAAAAPATEAAGAARPGAAPAAPAVVLLHGCGGAFDRRGRLDARLAAMAARLNAIGASALVVDSLTPRGEAELCTQRTGSRQVTQANRRRDALGALQWLAAQPGVDASRLGLVGWSNGGSTVLAATNRLHADVAAAAQQPSLAVAFYPGCDADLRRGWQSVTPLLLLLGDADDWTPAAPCKALAAAQAGARPPLAAPAVESYAGAWHGFDGSGGVRLRSDVPNGARPGAGVHVGGDAAARAASALRLHAFLRLHWGLPAPPAETPPQPTAPAR